MTLFQLDIISLDFEHHEIGLLKLFNFDLALLRCVGPTGSTGTPSKAGTSMYVTMQHVLSFNVAQHLLELPSTH